MDIKGEKEVSKSGVKRENLMLPIKEKVSVVTLLKFMYGHFYCNRFSIYHWIYKCFKVNEYKDMLVAVSGVLSRSLGLKLYGR